MILDQIRSDLLAAQKARDDKKVSILRYLLSQLSYAKIAKRAELTDDEIQKEIAKGVKRHQESIEAFAKGNRTELEAKEAHELSVLQTYLPEQLSEQAVTRLVSETIAEVGATSMADMGKVMGQLVPKLANRADNTMVSRLVREKLSS